MQLAPRVSAYHDTLARDNEFTGIGFGKAAQLRRRKCSRGIRMQWMRAGRRRCRSVALRQIWMQYAIDTVT
jgi:hypothetical protein